MRRAIIIGVDGQDGQLLYDLLLKMRYSVVGIDKSRIRCSSAISFKEVNILESAQVSNLIKEVLPKEVYYLAAFHHSAENVPAENTELLQNSYDVHVAGLANVLEAIRIFSPKTRLFYAASSHIFGKTEENMQDESTPINPNCIYGITKAAGLALCRFYRFRFGIFAVAGILYNHESSLRAEDFVSQRIIKGAVGIKRGERKKLVLGDLQAVIDWGYAPDYVRAMQLVLNTQSPDDFIIATGKRHTVLDFVKATFAYLGLDWRLYVKEECHIVRKQNVCRVGNPANLQKETGWKPSVDFKRMVELLLCQEGSV